MEISTLKTLARHIQKKTWDNKTLCILWIRALSKMMKLNCNLRNYVNNIRYQGADLQIDFEWARVHYSDIDPYQKRYRMRKLRYLPKANPFQ